ncbi:MAG: histidinol-phosphatase HisJ family protein [Acutalibacteraceae bacterium]
MLYFDSHIHTDNSPDGKYSAKQMCEGAAEKGIAIITFTDHCEIDEYTSDNYDTRTVKAYDDYDEVKDNFKGRLTVLSGIEIGQPLFKRDLTNQIISQRKYDYILASIHHPHGKKPDIKDIEYDKIDVYAFMEDYFSQLYEIAKWDGYDALAHLTCPMRRIQGKYKINFDYSVIQEATDELLSEIIRQKKAVEINTSGLRQDVGRTMPDENILIRYKQLGGKYITVGSDAHCPEDIGAGIQEGIRTALKCGFEQITIYKNREKQLFDII